MRSAVGLLQSVSLSSFHAGTMQSACSNEIIQRTLLVPFFNLVSAPSLCV